MLLVEEKGWTVLEQLSHYYLDKPFLLSMADHVFEAGFIEQISSEIPAIGTVNVLVEPRLNQVFSIDAAVKIKLDGNKVAAIGRGLTSYDAVDTGLFAASPELFDYVEYASKRGSIELSNALSLMANAGNLFAVTPTESTFIDVNTPSDVVHAEMRRQWGQVFNKNWFGSETNL